jgi:hypothetical protein
MFFITSEQQAALRFEGGSRVGRARTTHETRYTQSKEVYR